MVLAPSYINKRKTICDPTTGEILHHKIGREEQTKREIITGRVARVGEGGGEASETRKNSNMIINF